MRGCRRLTENEEPEQHRLYMAATSFDPGAPAVNVGSLLYCRIHRRPLIECHDEERPLS